MAVECGLLLIVIMEHEYFAFTNITCCTVWLWNVVYYVKGGTQAKDYTLMFIFLKLYIDGIHNNKTCTVCLNMNKNTKSLSSSVKTIKTRVSYLVNKDFCLHYKPSLYVNISSIYSVHCQDLADKKSDVPGLQI